MKGLILLCLIMSTQHQIKRFWLEIQWVDLKMLKWDQYLFHHKTLSISQCSCHNVVIFGCRGIPTLLDDVNALCWKVCCSWFLSDIMQTSRFSLLAWVSGVLFAGYWRSVLLERSKMGISTSNFVRKLYHGCDNQLGTTMVRVARSETILCYTFPITAKGGNA